MFKTIIDGYKSHYAEVNSTIKMYDIEEKFDLIFSRNLGLLFAKLGLKLNMSPNQVSIASLVFGVVGGALLYYQNDVTMTVAGSLLVTFAGVLDSADGQLARLSKQSSEFGRVLDGFIDNWVFISCYISATLYYVPIYGWWVFVFAVLAGMAQSSKSAIYEFYKSEYMYFGGGFKDAKIEYPEDVKKESWKASIMGRVLLFILQSYSKKQFSMTSRTKELRTKYEKYAFDPSTQGKFQELYRGKFKDIMTWWALVCGSNFHRTLIMGFSIYGRFDIYLAINILTLLPMYIIDYVQKRKDDDLIKQLEAELEVS